MLVMSISSSTPFSPHFMSSAIRSELLSLIYVFQGSSIKPVRCLILGYIMCIDYIVMMPTINLGVSLGDGVGFGTFMGDTGFGWV